MNVLVYRFLADRRRRFPHPHRPRRRLRFCRQLLRQRRKRWQVELGIRDLKQSMHLDVLRSKTPEMVLKELWAGILAYNLLRGTMSESAKRSGITPRQLSVKSAMQAVESFTPAMMVVADSAQFYDAFLTAVSARRAGNRPGRQEPRLKKRRQVWTNLMMKPRNEYFRRVQTKELP
jgi:hypothetical protein